MKSEMVFDNINIPQMTTYRQQRQQRSVHHMNISSTTIPAVHQIITITETSTSTVLVGVATAVEVTFTASIAAVATKIVLILLLLLLLQVYVEVVGCKT